MMNIKESLSSIFEVAICNSFPYLKTPPVVLALAQNPKFGDYQCNNAMALSKVKNKHTVKSFHAKDFQYNNSHIL